MAATPLWVACQNGHVGVVARLVQVGGLDVNQARTQDGATPLYVASAIGHVQVVERLVQVDGLDVNQACTGVGATPLWVACANGHLEVVKRLVQVHGLDVNLALTDVGATPLFMACQNGHVGVVEHLVSCVCAMRKCVWRCGDLLVLMWGGNGAGFVPQVKMGDFGIRSVKLVKYHPDGGVAWADVPLLFVQLKPEFEFMKALDNKCVSLHCSCVWVVAQHAAKTVSLAWWTLGTFPHHARNKLAAMCIGSFRLGCHAGILGCVKLRLDERTVLVQRTSCHPSEWVVCGGVLRASEARIRPLIREQQ